MPAKALVLNLLSLTATFGAMVWVFQEGNFAGVLDFTATGTLDATTPDPHVLHRLRAVDGLRGLPPVAASRRSTTGPATTTPPSPGAWSAPAASSPRRRLLMAVVFIAFATSGVSFIKLFGIGLTLAVLMDAFLIRAPSCRRSCAGRRGELVGAPLAAPGARPDRHQRDRRPRRRGGLGRDGATSPGPGTVEGDGDARPRTRPRSGEGERLRDEILAAAEQLLVETASEGGLDPRRGRCGGVTRRRSTATSPTRSRCSWRWWRACSAASTRLWRRPPPMPRTRSTRLCARAAPTSHSAWLFIPSTTGCFVHGKRRPQEGPRSRRPGGGRCRRLRPPAGHGCSAARAGIAGRRAARSVRHDVRHLGRCARHHIAAHLDA